VIPVASICRELRSKALSEVMQGFKHRAGRVFAEWIETPLHFEVRLDSSDG
jgi:hypothetical protein